MELTFYVSCLSTAAFQLGFSATLGPWHKWHEAASDSGLCGCNSSGVWFLGCLGLYTLLPLKFICPCETKSKPVFCFFVFFSPPFLGFEEDCKVHSGAKRKDLRATRPPAHRPHRERPASRILYRAVFVPACKHRSFSHSPAKYTERRLYPPHRFPLAAGRRWKAAVWAD